MEVARIARAHGLAGDVLVTLTSDVAERLAPGAQLIAEAKTLTVKSAHQHGQKWIVRFENVHDRTGAEALRGTVLCADVDDVQDGLWVHNLVGLDVVDANGTNRGAVSAVIANPAHDLLELSDGTLVPSVFITSVDDVIVVDVPEGIFS